MSDSKHVVLTNYAAIVTVDDDGAPVTTTTKHEAEMVVPVDQLDEFLADARTRWQLVQVTDEHPDDFQARIAARAAAEESSV